MKKWIVEFFTDLGWVFLIAVVAIGIGLIALPMALIVGLEELYKEARDSVRGHKYDEPDHIIIQHYSKDVPLYVSKDEMGIW